MLDCEAGDVRVFQPPPEDVEAETPEVGIYIARDFIEPIRKVAA
jgi:hypothetical protein